MSESAATATNRWYTELVTSANSLGEELGLDDMSTRRLRDFIFEKAKEQFKAGNRSGIRWARMNPPASRSITQEATA